MDSIKLLRDDVNTWRAAHRGRRGPLPIDLRRRAGVFALALGEDLVADELDIESKLLLAWGDRYGKVSTRRRASPVSSAFVEVRAQATPVASIAGSASIAIEVVRPGGSSIRITGAITAALVEAVIRSTGMSTPGA